jgi:dihydroflavonol-4-reductase
MRVFLTGGTGFIGQALVRALRGQGWAVTALVRDSNGAQALWLARQGCVLARGDVTDRESMRAPMSGVDLVLHNAGVYEFGADAALVERMRRVNVGGTDNTLGLATELGIGRTLYVSTVYAFGGTGDVQRDESYRRQHAPVHAYEQSKADAHDVALAWQERGLPLVIACPNAVVGPNDHSVFGYMLRLYLLHALPPIAWSPNTVVAPVEVGSLAEGLVRAAEIARPGEVYLFGGEPTSMRQLFELWKPHPGGMTPVLWLPPWSMKLLLAPLEPLERALGLPAFFSRETVAAGSLSLNYSSAKAQRDLAWGTPPAVEIWPRIIEAERALMAQRRGFLAKLRTMPVVK